MRTEHTHPRFLHNLLIFGLMAFLENNNERQTDVCLTLTRFRRRQKCHNITTTDVIRARRGQKYGHRSHTRKYLHPTDAAHLE